MLRPSRPLLGNAPERGAAPPRTGICSLSSWLSGHADNLASPQANKPLSPWRLANKSTWHAAGPYPSSRTRSLFLEHEGTPQLQILGLYCCLGAQAEKHLEAALQLLLESRQDRPPLLVVAVYDHDSIVATHSAPLVAKLHRLRSATLLSDGLALAEASPLRIDSTELLARAIYWVTAEREWPRLPVHEQVKDWAKASPEFSTRPGIHLVGQEFQFFDCPSDPLIAEASTRASKARQRFEHILADRESVKHEERRARGDRRERADVNLQKKELATQKTQEGNLLNICSAIHTCLVKVRDRFHLLQKCPCCRSKFVEKQKDADDHGLLSARPNGDAELALRATKTMPSLSRTTPKRVFHPKPLTPCACLAPTCARPCCLLPRRHSCHTPRHAPAAISCLRYNSGNNRIPYRVTAQAALIPCL